MNSKQLERLITILVVILLIPILLSFYNKPLSIDQVVNIIFHSKYGAEAKITDVDIRQYYPFTHQGLDGERLQLTVNDEFYYVTIAEYATNRKARLVARSVNELNKSTDNGHAVAFAYHNLVVQVFPSNTALSDDLLQLIKVQKLY